MIILPKSFKTIVPKKIMMYIRNKRIKGKLYYYLVEGKIDKRGKVKQKVLLYLGTAEAVYNKLKALKKNRN